MLPLPVRDDYDLMLRLFGRNSIKTCEKITVGRKELKGRVNYLRVEKFSLMRFRKKMNIGRSEAFVPVIARLNPSIMNGMEGGIMLRTFTHKSTNFILFAPNFIPSSLMEHKCVHTEEENNYKC